MEGEERGREGGERERGREGERGGRGGLTERESSLTELLPVATMLGE